MRRKISTKTAIIIILLVLLSVLALLGYVSGFFGALNQPLIDIPMSKIKTTQAQTSLSDLEGLRAVDAARVRAYDAVGLQGVQQAVSGAERDVVKVGVVDTGISPGHPEFSSVQLGSPVPLFDQRVVRDEEGCRIDASGHGTAVNGIIGANNVSDDSGYVYPHMNGVLSGARTSSEYLVFSS